MADSDSESLRTVKELTNNSPKTAIHQDLGYNSVTQPTDTAPPANRYPFHENLRKNLPLINPSALETLGTLMQEIQNTSGADPEILKSCEARWLQLFKLVEKQYQDQILSQQDQYQCQIQLIQDEIKALIQLQNDIGLAHCTARLPSFSELANDSIASGFHNGHHLEEQECEIESDVQSDCSETEEQLMATSECNREQKELQDNTLLTSGYGTFLASAQSSFVSANKARLNVANSTQNMKENYSIPLKHKLSGFPHLKENGQASFIFATGDEHSVALKFPNKPIQDMRTNQEASSNKSNLEIKALTDGLHGMQNKANGLTSWAQKVKQKNQKSKLAKGSGLERTQPQGCGPPQEIETPEDVNLQSAGSSHNCFYLNRPSTSPNSLVSNVSDINLPRIPSHP